MSIYTGLSDHAYEIYLFDVFVFALAMNEPKPEAETDCRRQAAKA